MIRRKMRLANAVSIRHCFGWTGKADAHHKKQGSRLPGWQAGSPRVVSIIIWIDAVTPMLTTPLEIVRSEVGRTLNSATLLQSTYYRLPEAKVV